MAEPRVTISTRYPGPVDGFTTVVATVDGGETGSYQVHSDLVDTPGETREILAQSATRTEIRAATRAGQD